MQAVSTANPEGHQHMQDISTNCQGLEALETAWDHVQGGCHPAIQPRTAHNRQALPWAYLGLLQLPPPPPRHEQRHSSADCKLDHDHVAAVRWVQLRACEQQHTARCCIRNTALISARCCCQVPGWVGWVATACCCQVCQLLQALADELMSCITLTHWVGCPTTAPRP
jgi:hypothetical protein